MISLKQMKGDMTWKNYVAAIGLLLTIATILMTSGRILEQIEATRADMVQMKAAQAEYARSMTAMQINIERQAGKDAVHDEQIGGLRRDVNGMMKARGH